MKCRENNEKFYLIALYYPTKSSLNLNDINQFLILKYLQDAFNVPVIIHVMDNHRFLNDSLNINEFPDLSVVKDVFVEHFSHSINKSLDDIKKMNAKEIVKIISNPQGIIKEDFKMKFTQILAHYCIKEIISIGFDVKSTFVCRNLKYIGQCANYYQNIIKLGSKITFAQSISLFKNDYSNDIETISLVSKDISALFAHSYPDIFNAETNIRGIALNLAPQSVSLSRRLAVDMKWPKPALLTTKPLPALPGTDEMRSGVVNSAIFFGDNEKTVKNKINKFAFSGGKDTVEEHQRLGGNCDVDVSYQYLRYFLDDNERLETVRVDYSAGKLLTGALKAEAAAVITSVLGKLQKNALGVSNDVIEEFMRPRLLDCGTMVARAGEACEDAEEEIAVVQEDVAVVEAELADDATVGDVVTPWEVVGDADSGVNYDKLVELYGSSKIEKELVEKFETITGAKAHHLLSRGMFYSHR